MTVATTRTAIAKDSTYVAGYLIDESGNLLNGSIFLVHTSTGQPVTPGDTPFLLTDGSYSAWTTGDINEVGVLFAAKGFKTRVITFADLLQAPDVIMKPEGSSEIAPWMILAVVAAVVIFRKKTKKVGAIASSDVLVIFLIIGGTIGLTIVIKILRGLGILGGQNVAGEIEDPNSPWKPGYWQKFTTFTYAITEGQAADFAKTIYNAFGVFQDNWNAISAVFSQMKTKANVSFLAWKFQKEYDEDLLPFLQNGGGILPWDGLSTSHMDTLIDLVKNLKPN